MERTNEEWRFEGFASPNFTSVPDEFFDYVAPRLSGGEVKVALYMIRRTYGFKKESDNISISQMLNGIVRRDGTRLDDGAGLSKTTLLESLKRLEEKNIIYRVQQWDMRGACIATNYRLNVKGYTPGLKTDQGGPGLKTDQGQVGNQTRGLVQKPTTQDTVNNKQFNKNVNVSNKAKQHGPLHDLPDRNQPKGLTDLIADDILSQLGDAHSKAFYRLVARKVPERVVRQILSEIKHGGADSPAKVFTSKMLGYARDELGNPGAALAWERKALAERFRRKAG
jgi:hypothetical protein